MGVFGRIIATTSLAAVVLYLTAEVYLKRIVTQFAFGGFYEAPEKNLFIGVVSVLITTICVLLVKSKVFQVYAGIFLVFLIQPSMILMTYGGQKLSSFLITLCSLYVVAGVFLVLSRLRKGVKKNVDVKKSYLVIVAPLLFMTLFVLFFVGLKANFSLRLNVNEIYDFRFDLNDLFVFPLNYLIPFSAGSLLGLLAAIAVESKKYFHAIFVMAIGVVYYGFTTHKSYMFNGLFAVIVLYLVRPRVGFVALLQLFVLVMLSLILVVDAKIVDYVAAMFANRILFLPSLISYTYIEEFSRIGYMYWAESKIGFNLFVSPLHENSVNYIGEVMTGDSKNVANVGWVASGFMNLGLVGVCIYAFIIAIILKAIEEWNDQVKGDVVLAAFSISFINIILSVDLVVSMLSTGLLFMLILIPLLIRLSKLER